MSDSDDLDLDGDESSGSSSSKKSFGLGALLPNLLKFVAIGLAALIFIITVSVITYNILNKRGESQTVMDPTSEYIGTRPQFATFSLIGSFNTRTRDQTHMVVVDMLIEYDLNNTAAQTELNGRVDQLRDFTRNYFASKYYNDLMPENEDRIKQEIREILNNRFLDTAKARGILFNKLDVIQL